MTTEEALALAVLKGDLAAANALADLLVEKRLSGGVTVPLMQRITCPLDRLRVALFFPVRDDVTLDYRSTMEAVRLWLEGGRPLILCGCERMEMYELPEES